MNLDKMKIGVLVYFITRFRLIPVKIVGVPEQKEFGEWWVMVRTESDHPTGWPYPERTYQVNCALVSKATSETRRIVDALEKGELKHTPVFTGADKKCQLCGMISTHKNHRHERKKS
jgi:hypothetical protein